MPESKSGALTTWRHPSVAIKNKWGGRRESNSRPPGPQSGALTNWATPAIYLVRLKRFELLTHGLEGRCSIQLSYKRRFSDTPAKKRVERVMGIGPTRPAWKAGILPLNYTRIYHTSAPYRQRLYIIALFQKIVKSFSPLFSKKSQKFQYFLFFIKIIKKMWFFHSIRKNFVYCFDLFPYFQKKCYNNYAIII